MKTRSRLAMLALAAAVSLGACSNSNFTNEAASGADPAGASAQSTTSINAQIKVDKAEIKAEPDAKSKTVSTLNQKNNLGSKTTLLVLDSRDGWLNVALPTRPNGSTGWIEERNVDLRGNDLQIRVDLGSRKAVVTRGDQTVLETPVAIGTNDNPTPKGNFYVTDLVQTDQPGGAYGPFALGLSAHSETLTEFGGGDGQVAIHGTNDPSSIGKPVSHGCIRVSNDTITKLAKMAPLGTPVTIV